MFFFKNKTFFPRLRGYRVTKVTRLRDCKILHISCHYWVGWFGKFGLEGLIWYVWCGSFGLIRLVRFGIVSPIL